MPRPLSAGSSRNAKQSAVGGVVWLQFHFHPPRLINVNSKEAILQNLD
jgi:hypothetical protein